MANAVTAEGEGDRISPAGRVVLLIAGLGLAIAYFLALDTRLHADDFHMAGRIDLPFTTSVVDLLTSPDPEATRHFRPATRIVQLGVLSVSGLNPSILHAYNLILHSIAVGLLFALIRSLGGTNKMAIWGAVIFALHPTHAEPVIWASGISGLSEAMFHLGALYALDRWIQSDRGRFGIAAVLAFAIATLFKESALTFLLTGTLLWWWRVRKPRIPWPMIFAFGWTFILVLWRWRIGVESSANFEFTANPVGWVRNAFFYLIQFMLPVRSAFRTWGFDSYFQLRDALPVVPNQTWLVVVIGITGLVGAVVLFQSIRRWPPLVALGLGLAVAAILPFLAHQGTGMRILYLASAGLSFALASIVFSGRSRPVVIGLFYGWIVVMSISFVERAAVWREAGDLAENVATQAAVIRNAEPTDRAVVFLDIPRRDRGAFVFTHSFTPALQGRVRNPEAQVIDFDVLREKSTIPVDAAWYRWTGMEFVEVPGDME